MIYRHRFRVRAPRARVAAFHRRSASLGAITPPPIAMRVQHAPAELGDGDEMAFTLWLGPLPVRWAARIEGTGDDGFRDSQVRGPFASWEHDHRFVVVDESTTDVIDTIHYRLRRHPLWGPFGLAMGLGLPLLFAFRGWKTGRLLENGG